MTADYLVRDLCLSAGHLDTSAFYDLPRSERNAWLAFWRVKHPPPKPKQERR